MSNPSMSSIPGVNAINDTLDFVKKLWGGMGVPGMAVPTVSVDEINQKISELKAVESWLNVNMSMLRSTIHTLEVQSATLSAVQSMGAAMGAALKPGGEQPSPFASMASAMSKAGPSGSTQAGKDAPPGMFSFPNWPPSAFNATPDDNRAPASAAPTPAPAPAAAAPQAAASASASGATGAADADASPAAPPIDFGAAMAAPTAWWNMLQNQFVQAVSNAMSEEKKAGNDGGDKKPAADAASSSGKASASAQASNEPPSSDGASTASSGGPKLAPRKRKPA